MVQYKPLTFLCPSCTGVWHMHEMGRKWDVAGIAGLILAEVFLELMVMMVMMRGLTR